MERSFYLVLAILLLSAGCKKHNNTAPSMPTPEVLVSTPVRQDVTYVYEYPAYLEAIQTVNLVARVSGFLEKIQYVPGQHVKAGAPLFVIEPQPYIDRVNAAKAQQKSTEATLAYARSQYERMKEARLTQAVSEIDYIQAESGYRTAQANIQDAAAQLDIALINLGYCHIKAPFDGRVSRNLIDQGNFVGGSVQPVTLATMYRDNVMYAYFNMSYSEFQNLPPASGTGKSGNQLPLTVNDAANPDKTWKGTLDYTSPNVDLQTGTVSVRAIVPNPNEELLSGMYVKAQVPYKQVPGALLIPEASIGTNQTGRFAYIVGKDDRIVLQPLQVGILTPGGLREITSGINADDRYVVEALMTVRPGMTVKPISPDSSRQTTDKQNP